MNETISALVVRLEVAARSGTSVIPWSCPVPSFGDLSRSTVATLGLNPSNREFVDVAGRELEGGLRRFHTLKSLGIDNWSEADDRHLQLICDACRDYFSRNPYDGWFKKLDYLLSGTRVSYYGQDRSACHLDLIPYATSCKWTELAREQKTALLEIAGDTLALLLRDSPVRLLILNGNSVVEQFQRISGIQLSRQIMSEWALPRQSTPDVAGLAYRGLVQSLFGVRLKRKVLVLGFNHNIQSSFGVTRQVTTAIRRWIAKVAETEVNL